MAGPWERYANPVPEERGPWQQYGRAAEPPPAGPGYAEDIAKGAAGGLGRGTAGLVGLPGDVAEYGARGIDWATRKVGGALGIDVAPREERDPTYGSAAAQRNIESVTGPFYQPKTVPGEYASTIASFVPGAAIGGGGAAARGINILAPGVVSETAGQVTKGTSAEPAARVMGGILGGVGGAKLVTPAAPPTPARAAAVRTLEEAGIPVSAGVRTGSRPVQWAESVAGDMPLSAGAAGRLTERTKSAYDRAITERLFGPGMDESLPKAGVMKEGRQALSDEYTRLTQANQLRADPQLINDIYAAERNYAQNALPSQKATGRHDIATIRDQIADALVQGQGSAPGAWYQRQRSTLGKHEASLANSDPYAATAMKDMKTALDQAMARSLPADDAAAWSLNNERWRNMKRVENAAATAGEHLSPAGVAQSVRSGRAGQYARSTDEFDELARAGAMVLKELPQSGTAPRTAMQNMFNLPTLLSSGGGGALGSTFGPLGALAGAAAPSLAMRGVVSGPGQAYLGNQLAPQRMRDILAQTLAQQAMTQGGVQRRSAERRQREEEEAAAELRRHRLAR